MQIDPRLVNDPAEVPAHVVTALIVISISLMQWLLRSAIKKINFADPKIAKNEWTTQQLLIVVL